MRAMDRTNPLNLRHVVCRERKPEWGRELVESHSHPHSGLRSRQLLLPVPTRIFPLREITLHSAFLK